MVNTNPHSFLNWRDRPMAAALRDSRSPGIAPDPAAGPSKELLPWPLFPMDMRIEELNGPPEKRSSPIRE